MGTILREVDRQAVALPPEHSNWLVQLSTIGGEEISFRNIFPVSSILVEQVYSLINADLFPTRIQSRFTETFQTIFRPSELI